MKSNWFVWAWVGMAYFNTFSSLNLPQTWSSAIAALPILLVGLWYLRRARLPTAQVRRLQDDRLTDPQIIDRPETDRL
jgi:TRAP-type C4-dicarboxylate transport system permease small subunit